MTDGLPPVPMKQCAFCGAYKPLGTEHYSTNHVTDDGYASVCLECEGKQEQKKHEEEFQARLAKLRGTSLKVLDTMTDQGTEVPHIAEVYQRLMELCGGSAGFAKEVYLHMVSAKPGGMVKQRSLDVLLRLAEKVSESGAAQKSLDSMSNEELDEEIQKSLPGILNMQDALEETRENGILEDDRNAG